MTGPSRRAALSAEALWFSRSAAAAAARGALAPLSALFAAGVCLRGALYDHGLLGRFHAPAPVLSVGGLSVGGSGKTPFVIWFARRLRGLGHRPCIVTRGYGGDGRTTTPFLLDAVLARDPRAVDRAGDEAVLLALRSGGPVAVGADRLRACELAASRLAGTADAPDVFLLDDGFQHRRLARDLDVVLVSGREASQRLLPAGPLREGVSALSRSDVVVLMGQGDLPLAVGSAGAGSDPPAAPVPVGKGRRPAALALRASTRVSALVSAVTDANGDDPSVLAGRAVVAVAAIARPERFLADLERTGARVVASVLRRDHHRYDEADRRAIDAAAANADWIVTTEKDLVKLTHGTLAAPLRALRIEVQVDAADEGRLLERARAAFDR